MVADPKRCSEPHEPLRAVPLPSRNHCKSRLGAGQVHETGTDEDQAPETTRAVVGAVFLVTGAALVAHIVLGLPLLAGTILGVGFAVVVLLVIRARGDLPTRVLRVGVVSGLVATLAYDLSRVALTVLADLPVNPFEAWRFFGAGLIGEAAPEQLQWVAGALFHVTNGVAFAVAYTVWFGTRGPLWGIVYGLCLEGFMLGLYPGWLNITAYAPFLAVSLLGHVVYGFTLGTLSRKFLLR